VAGKQITVGEAARRSCLSPKAVRLYEARGILPTADRTSAGYRTYTDSDVEILRFVRQAKALGLRLEEIKRILDLQRHGAQPCSTVEQLLKTHITEIDQTIKDLRALRRTLATALQATTATANDGQETVVCPIIQSQAG
jgi:DNA-binding transcriptional MerR regulator